MLGAGGSILSPDFESGPGSPAQWEVRQAELLAAQDPNSFEVTGAHVNNAAKLDSIKELLDTQGVMMSFAAYQRLKQHGIVSEKASEQVTSADVGSSPKPRFTDFAAQPEQHIDAGVSLQQGQRQQLQHPQQVSPSQGQQRQGREPSATRRAPKSTSQQDQQPQASSSSCLQRQQQRAPQASRQAPVQVAPLLQSLAERAPRPWEAGAKPESQASPQPNGASISRLMQKLNVNQFRAACRKYGLPVDGDKHQLAARLLAHVLADGIE